MMHITTFNNDWYARYIAQAVGNFSEDTPADAVAVAKGIMVAGAFIAEAIDQSIGQRNEDNVVAQLSNVAGSITDLANAVESMSENLH